ncbi:MAG: TIGR00282 family metallophosphoesterase [Erysipelotrichia bacterium]|nr:TIGR00282 family metallophosphoesterase [Erysipelotrichia bacterium]
MVSQYVPMLKAEKQIDYVVANGENAAHGKGITKKIYHQLLNNGVDLITLGNHAFSKDTIFNFIDEAKQMLRPMNLLPLAHGQAYKIVEINGLRVCFVNLMCNVFMVQVEGSPFDCMEEILDEVEADIYFVDLHGEATSEKIAFSYYFEKYVQVVVGTHTHVQTADERIENGSAFISDVGMCGAYRSVIGRDIEEVLTRFTTNQKTRFTVAEGEGIFCAVMIDIDEQTKQATKIERIQIRPSKEAN